MSQLPYPYQLEPYTYRVVPYSPVAQYGARYNPYHIPPSHDYYYHPAAHPSTPYVDPDQAYSRPRGRPALSEDQKLQNLRERLIKDEPAADPHLPLWSAPAAAAAKPSSPEAAPEVIPLPLPPQEETTATCITHQKVLYYPVKLHHEHKAKLHARNNKPSTSRSAYTVFVIVHEVNGINVDIQVSNDLGDANAEVLRIMERYHPETFKLVPVRQKAVVGAAATGALDANAENENNNTEKGQLEKERQRRFVYRGRWRFTHASTLKLEAKHGNSVIKIWSALNNVRHERKDPKQVRKEKRRGGAAAGVDGLTEV